MRSIRHGRAWYGRDCYRNDAGEITCVSWISGGVGNPNRVPSKAAGRRGTRRAYKRTHPPGRGLWAYFDLAAYQAEREELILEHH